MSDVGDFDRRANPRSEDEAVADVAVVAAGGFVVEDAGGIGWHRVGARAVATDVIGHAVVRADGDADVAAIGKELAGTVGSEINVLAVSGTAANTQVGSLPVPSRCSPLPLPSAGGLPHALYAPSQALWKRPNASPPET